MRENNVFEISDYRSFLCAYAEGKKAQSKTWNYSTWARSLGLKSTSSITKILSGDRKPGPDIINSLVKYFKFTQEEERHFRNLIALQHDNQTNIQALQRRVLELFEFKLVSEWQNFTVLELFRLKALRKTPMMIKRLLKSSLSEEQIQKSVSLLQSLGLIKKDIKGNWIVPDAQIQTQNDVSSDAIKMYHTQMLEHAKERLSDTPIEERSYQALTLLIDRKDLPRLRRKIRQFAESLEPEFQSKTVNQLYQVQVQLFPITKEFERAEKDEL